MTRITENTIEEFTIKLLQRSGYEYIYAPDIAHDGDNPQRESYEDILLHEKLRLDVQRINPTIPSEIQFQIHAASFLKLMRKLYRPPALSGLKLKKAGNISQPYHHN